MLLARVELFGLYVGAVRCSWASGERCKTLGSVEREKDQDIRARVRVFVMDKR